MKITSRVRTVLTLALWAMLAPSLSADEPFLPQTVLEGTEVLPLYPADSPLLKTDRVSEPEQYNTNVKSDAVKNVINIHNPTMEVVLAPPEKRNGTFVILAPGGGHKILWVGPEGYDVAQWLAERGVSSAVLRNRLRVDGYEPTVDAVRDAFAAIALAKHNAARWKIDPEKIGIIGFSAGAELAAPAAVLYKQDRWQEVVPESMRPMNLRPAFAALVYPGPTPFTKQPDLEVPKDAPPTFIVCAGSDDAVHAQWADDYFRAMLDAKIPNLEMHIYGRGGHGGSIRPRTEGPFSTWSDRLIDWMADLDLVEPQQ